MGEFWTEIVEWCNDPYNYADLYKDQSDHWSHALGAPHNTGGQVTSGKRYFHNPGDQKLFWVANLVVKYRHKLQPSDFPPFLMHEK